MNAHQFDRAARLVATSTSRRSVIGMVAALLTGATLNRTALADQCSGFGEACVESGCCDGLTCIDGTCYFPCLGAGESCAVDGDGPAAACCSGICGDDGVCTPEPVTCAASGAVCSSDAGTPCCDPSEICLSGVCSAPPPHCSGPGGSCAGFGNPECCTEGLDCVDGTCVVPVPVCYAPGDPCLTDDACCAGICCNGTCADLACCPPDPEPDLRCAAGTTCLDGACVETESICTDDAACVEGACCCDDGSCAESCCPSVVGGVSEQPVPAAEPVVLQLPNTGTGSEAAGKSLWGAAVLAGGCGLMGRALRRMRT